MAAPILTAGNTYTLSVGVSLCSNYPYSHEVFAWFDWNDDQDFSDSGEQYILYPYAFSMSHTVSISVTVPVAATTGTTRMRIMVDEGTISGPCHTGSYGETEDY